MAAPKKKVSRRRREKKNIEKGQAHIRSSFDCNDDRYAGERSFPVELRGNGLPRF